MSKWGEEETDQLKKKLAQQNALVSSFAAGSTGGATLDAAINALSARVDGIDARVSLLESSGVAPPEPPEPEPGPDKRYPDRNDPSVGLPAGTQLQDSGPTTISEDGAKVSGKRFKGRVTIAASNVELFNCEIDADGDWWAVMIEGDAANVHHCTITSDSTMGNSAINTAEGSHIHHNRFVGFENAFNIAGNDNVIEWNEAWQLKGNADSHYDALQADGGLSNLTIRNNYFDVPYGQTAACMLDNYFGPLRDILVENNFLGGGGFPAYLDGSFQGSANATGIEYRNNVMRKGGWGYFYRDSAGTDYVRSGNVDWQTGANVDDK